MIDELTELTQPIFVENGIDAVDSSWAWLAYNKKTKGL